MTGIPGGQFSLLGGGSDSLVGSPIKPSQIAVGGSGGGYGGSSWASSSSTSMEGSSCHTKTAPPGRRRGVLPPGVYAATPVRGDKPLSSAHKRAIVCAVNGSIPQGVFVHHSKEVNRRPRQRTIHAPTYPTYKMDLSSLTPNSQHQPQMQKSSVAATVNAMEVYGHGEGGMGLSFMRTDGKAHRDEMHKGRLHAVESSSH